MTNTIIIRPGDAEALLPTITSFGQLGLDPTLDGVITYEGTDVNGLPTSDAFSALTSFDVTSDARFDLDFQYRGNDGFASNLTSIFASSTAGEVEVGIDADEFGNVPSLDFMKSLQTIEIQAGTGQADLSLSSDGVTDFMSSLTSILVESGAGAEMSLSASVNSGEDGRKGDGAKFMAALDSVRVIAGNGGASMSISNSGGANFMESLREIEVISTGDHTEEGANFFDASLSLSASAATEGDLILRGENFMPELRSIKVVSEADDASASISHSGADDFLTSLVSIEVTSGELDNAELSISASANFIGPADGGTDNELLRGDNFMGALRTIRVSSEGGDRASASISHSGGDNFMESLRNILVVAADGENAQISVSASANFKTLNNGDTVELTGANFMGQLNSIRAISDGGQASISISHSGGTGFMDSLTKLRADETSLNPEVDAYARAVISISASHNFEGAVGGDFMSNLQSIRVKSEMGLASFSLSADAGTDILENLSVLLVDGGGSSTIELDNGSSDEFVGGLEQLNVEGGTNVSYALSERGGIDVDLVNETGNNYMASLERVNLKTDFGAHLNIANGSALAAGGADFLESLDLILMTSGFGSDIDMTLAGVSDLAALTAIRITGSQNADGDQTLADITSFFADNPVLGDAVLATAKMSDTMIEIDGTGSTNALASLTQITVDHSTDLLAGADDQDIDVTLTSIEGGAYTVSLVNRENGEIAVEAFDTPGLEKLVLTGDSTATADISGDQAGLRAIDVRGMSAGSVTEIDMNTVTGSAGIKLLIGETTLDVSASSANERFIFRESAMDATLDGFDTGNPAGAGDQLNMRSFGLSSLSDLTLDDSGADLVITAAGGAFSGSITLVGVDSALDVSDNFIF